MAVLKQVPIDACVSAADVVRSVAAFVGVPTLFEVSEPEVALAKVEFRLWRGIVRRAYPMAEAAAQLAALLKNNGAHAPRWFAWDDPTGLPQTGVESSSEGHRILVSRSEYLNRLLRVPESQFHWMRFPPRMDEREGDSVRLEHIGFVREEIVAFLNIAEVPHSLETAPGSNPDRVLEDTAQNACIDLSSTAPDELGVQEDRIGRDRDPIALKIRLAVREARRNPPLRFLTREDRALINESWEVFKGWAIDCQIEPIKPPVGKGPHYPITGFDFEADKVVFDPVISHKSMNLKAFAKRVNPRWR